MVAIHCFLSMSVSRPTFITFFYNIVRYLPKKENGEMDDLAEMTRIDLWNSIPHCQDNKEIDVDCVFYPENIGYVVGRIFQG